MTTDDPTPTTSKPARPPQGTRAELEDTQRWWLAWVYGPAMGILALGALASAVAGTGDRRLSAALFVLTAGSLAGAALGLRRRWSQTGRLALDERDEQQTMRTMGYAYCFVFLGLLAWSVAWAATNDDGVPVPLIVLAGTVLALGLGRLCTRREGL